MWMLQTGVMGPKSGRSLGLSHFDAKRSYASQRKQLSNYAPDRAYIRHWLVDDHRDVDASKSSHQGRLHNRLMRGRLALSFQGGDSESRPIRDDNDEDPERRAKHQARLEQSSENALVQLSESVGKGKGKHRRYEHADARLTDGPKKRRWGRNAEGTSYSELTVSGA